MSREPSVRYFKTRKGYYCQIGGKQHRLATGPRDEPDGPTYTEAKRRFAELQGTGSEDATVSQVIEEYLYSLQQAGKKNTEHLATTVLASAMRQFGHMKVQRLKPHHVHRWLEQMSDPARDKGGRTKPWGDTTQHIAVSKLSRAFNWARKRGRIAANPIAEIEKPEKRSRGSEVVIPEGLQDILIASANREFAKVLRFLRGTGCRPGEAVHARASHYRPSIRALVCPWQGDDVGWRWKNARQKRDRVIYLNDEIRELVEGEIKKRPDGYVFQTIRGSNLTLNNLVNLLTRLLRHPDVLAWCGANGYDPDRVILYGFRHSYITRMLARGVPIKVLADWCGTSVAMLEKNYSHIHDDFEAMRNLFDRFNGSSPPSS